MPNLFHVVNCTCVVDFIREHSKSNHEQYNSFIFIISSLIMNTFKKRLSSLIYGRISSICIAQLHVLLNQKQQFIHVKMIYSFILNFFGIQSCSQISFIQQYSFLFYFLFFNFLPPLCPPHPFSFPPGPFSLLP
jgi:hypothetical protein